MAPHLHNRHLLAYSLAGVMGIAYYYWRSQNKDTKRKDGDALLWQSYSQLEDMLVAQQDCSIIAENSSGCIYLDYNGTTPVYAPVLAAMLPYFTTHFGNPSSGHAYGRHPRRAIDQARQTLLNSCLGMENDSPNMDITAIWFTASGTEADNLAIQLALQSTAHLFLDDQSKPHIVTSNVEHPAVSAYLGALEDQARITVTYVPVGKDGCVDAQEIMAAVTETTILVTLMLANNESGALQPVKEVSEACRKRGVLIHTDAAQALGKVSCRLDDLGYPDMVSMVGHKVGAPKGIAALYVRPKCYEENGRSLPHQHGILLLGGGQEHGRRGGTENTPYIVGFAVAAALATKNLSQTARHMGAMRSQLLSELESNLAGSGIAVRANGPENPAKRLPNTLSVGLQGIHSGDLLAEIGDKVAASAGATCHSAVGISQVLRAMQVPDDFARGTVRLSVGPTTSPSQISKAAKWIADAAIEQSQTDTI